MDFISEPVCLFRTMINYYVCSTFCLGVIVQIGGLVALLWWGIPAARKIYSGKA